VELTQCLFDFLREKFSINLKIWYNIPLEPQHKSVKNISPILARLDPLSLFSVYQIAQNSKSTALAIAMVLDDGISLD
jgi:hypothetical protein